MNNADNQKEKLKALFLTFFKIGLFTFGGGYAMIPLIEYEIVEQHHWIESEDILDIFAIASAAPGVIAVNTATFVGYRVAGFWGSLLSTVGIALPSYVIISTIAIFYQQFKSMEWVNYAFSGIRVGVIVLILGAVIEMGKRLDFKPLTIFLVLVSFLLAVFTEINIILLLLGGAVVGIVDQLIFKKNMTLKKGEGKE